jgi:hypothetical protein
MAGTRGWVLFAGAVIAAVTAAVFGIRASSDDRPPERAGPASPDGVQAGEVARALAALSADPASLVASGATGQVGGRARQAVPDGSVVRADEGSWAPDGMGGGTITVTVTPPGATATTYTAVMVEEGGRWKVLATMPLAPPRANGASP